MVKSTLQDFTIKYIHIFESILEVYFIKRDSCVVPSTGFEPVAYGLELSFKRFFSFRIR